VHEEKAIATLRARAWSALSWTLADGVIELALHRAPCNELGSESLEEFEKFVNSFGHDGGGGARSHHFSEMKPGFCAGADLRELYQRSQAMEKAAAGKVCGISWSAFIAC